MPTPKDSNTRRVAMAKASAMAAGTMDKIEFE